MACSPARKRALSVPSHSACFPVVMRRPAHACPLHAPPCSFPIPFIIAGRWCLPLPAPTGLRFVIGQPIRAPKPAKAGEPSEAEVDAFHAQFYDGLKVRTWAGRRKRQPGSRLIRVRSFGAAWPSSYPSTPPTPSFVQELWGRHAPKFPGYEDVKLGLV